MLRTDLAAALRERGAEVATEGMPKPGARVVLFGKAAVGEDAPWREGTPPEPVLILPRDAVDARIEAAARGLRTLEREGSPEALAAALSANGTASVLELERHELASALGARVAHKIGASGALRVEHPERLRDALEEAASRIAEAVSDASRSVSLVPGELGGLEWDDDPQTIRQSHRISAGELTRHAPTPPHLIEKSAEGPEVTRLARTPSHLIEASAAGRDLTRRAPSPLHLIEESRGEVDADLPTEEEPEALPLTRPSFDSRDTAPRPAIDPRHARELLAASSGRATLTGRPEPELDAPTLDVDKLERSEATSSPPPAIPQPKTSPETDREDTRATRAESSPSRPAPAGRARGPALPEELEAAPPRHRSSWGPIKLGLAFMLLLGGGLAAWAFGLVGVPEGENEATETPALAAAGEPMNEPPAVEPAPTSEGVEEPTEASDEERVEEPEALDEATLRRRSDEEVERGVAAERAGDWIEARRAYEAALETYALQPHALAGLARERMAAGDGEGAVRYAERAVALRRRRTAYRVLLGDAHRLAGAAAPARRAYEAALELDPEDTTARGRLGRGE